MSCECLLQVNITEQSVYRKCIVGIKVVLREVATWGSTSKEVLNCSMIQPIYNAGNSKR